MDAKTEKSLSRTREELNLYEPVLAALKLLPEGDPSRLQISILETLIQQHSRTIECVETGEPFLASQYTNPVELLTAMDVHWYFHIQQMFAGSGTGGGIHIAEDLEGMDDMAVPNDCCTFLRLALYYQVEGLLPVPSAYLALT